jgi:hypothetical protein
LSHDRDAHPLAAPRSADIIAFESLRRRAPAAKAAARPDPDPALIAALRQASEGLITHGVELDRHARSLAGCTDDLERIGRRLAAEAVRARAIAVQAEQIGSAIEAGDFDALRLLHDEVARRAVRAI